MFRARSGVWRWRDSGWLAWLMVLAYLLHNFEQYGVDAEGRAFRFSVIACAQYGFDSLTGCPLAPSFFAAGLYFPSSGSRSLPPRCGVAATRPSG